MYKTLLIIHKTYFFHLDTSQSCTRKVYLLYIVFGLRLYLQDFFLAFKSVK